MNDVIQLRLRFGGPALQRSNPVQCLETNCVEAGKQFISIQRKRVFRVILTETKKRRGENRAGGEELNMQQR